MSGYVDAHCHLGQYDDPVATLGRAHDAGVITVAVTESPEEFRRLRTRLGSRAGLRLALGAHPLKVEVVAGQLARFERLLFDTEWVGEVGLDYSSHGRSSAKAQRTVFESILAMPQVSHKILTVHSRRAERDTIAMLADANVTAALHWWTGPRTLIASALDASLWFSVNSAMCRSANGRATIADLPRHRVVTETDGPFNRGASTPATPASIPKLVAALAGIWGVDPEEVRRQVWANMTALHDAAIPPAVQSEATT